MGLTAAIHQPQYLPWLPYFDKVDRCDVFVHLDNVQFQHGGYQNRNRIKTHRGPHWLTVPVRASLADRVCDVRIADGHWASKHVATIEFEYAHAPYVSWFRDELKPLLLQGWERLVDLNVATTTWFFDRLGITSRHLRASELAARGAKDDLVVNICQAIGATVYLSGPGARAYQDPDKFRAAGIELQYQEYHAPEYEQRHPAAGFAPDLSALDLLLNLGSDARAVLAGGRKNV